MGPRSKMHGIGSESGAFSNINDGGSSGEWKGALDNHLYESDIKAIKELFDADFYRFVYEKQSISDEECFSCYLREGLFLGQDPSPEFCHASYLEANPDVKEAGANALLHYIRYGITEKRSLRPEPVEALKDTVAPILSISEAFDPKFYLEKYPDVTSDPYAHYATIGWKDGRDPTPWFSTRYYLENNPDVAQAQINPFEHYVYYGHAEDRAPGPSLAEQFGLKFDPRSRQPLLPMPVRGNQAIKNSKLTVGVHIHCFYFDLLEKILAWVSRIPAQKKIFISISDPRLEEAVRLSVAREGLNLTRLAVVPNRGRDLAPMVVEFGQDLLGCDVCLHVHTKKSVERGVDGAYWLKEIEKNLIFNQQFCRSVMELFENFPSCGAVMPNPSERIRPFMVWGKNKVLAEGLLEMFGATKDVLSHRKVNFPAGSMFWFRPSALKQVLNSKLSFEDFPAEPVGDDGTLAHALERCLSHVVECNGYLATDVEPLPYHMCWPPELPRRVSVIIPVYNGLPWVKQAVSSVLLQSAANAPTEIILVDNGSSDGSTEVLNGLAKVYSNVKVITETEKGAGAARNAGISAAKGEYVMFLDADDVLFPDAIEKLLAVADKNKSRVDFATSSLIMFDEDESGPVVPFGGDNTYEIVSGIDDRTLGVWSMLFSDFGPCAKIYRRKFLIENGIKFPSGINFEDNSFVFDVYLRASHFGVLRRPTYMYRRYKSRNGETQSTTLNASALVDQLAVLTKIITDHDLLTDRSIKNSLALRAIARKLDAEIGRFGRTPHVLGLLRRYPHLTSALDICGVAKGHGHFSRGVK